MSVSDEDATLPMTASTGPALSPDKAAEIRASFARQGLLRGFGAAMGALGQGRCTLELPFTDAVGQQAGFFHGGAIGALADTAGGYAAATLLPLGADVLTLEYKINFLRPARPGLLVAEAIVLRAGRSVVVARVDVFVEMQDGRVLCAAAQQSLMRAPDRPS